MTALPLISHTSPDAIVAYRGAVPIDARHFLADVARLADRLPAGRHVLNICADRYRFTVGWAASLLARKVSLLPSTHTPQVIRQLAAFAPDAFCLTDDARCDIELPQFQYPDETAATLAPWRVPQIEAERLTAYVFTSGSTGAPVPHRKTWGRLVRCVSDEAQRLGLLDGRSHAIIGTVPAQHMYGFESTVLVCLQSGNALCAERPFYPADICRTVASLPRPRALVSTPIHLRALLAMDAAMPPLDLTVCATAMLSQELAREVEARFNSPLLEIYGSTETGQIASRRTAATSEWQLWPEVELTDSDGETWAQGGHIEQPVAMGDVLERISSERFLMHGRTQDLVNIAGKRSSLGYLNHQLNAIPGVIDGSFFVREEEEHSSPAVTRLAALVVAPTLEAAGLLQQLRQRIDAVFLPRPLLFVERLPRNAAGKLPREALRALCPIAPNWAAQE